MSERLTLSERERLEAAEIRAVRARFSAMKARGPEDEIARHRRNERVAVMFARICIGLALAVLLVSVLRVIWRGAL